MLLQEHCISPLRKRKRKTKDNWFAGSISIVVSTIPVGPFLTRIPVSPTTGSHNHPYPFWVVRSFRNPRSKTQIHTIGLSQYMITWIGDDLSSVIFSDKWNIYPCFIGFFFLRNVLLINHSYIYTSHLVFTSDPPENIQSP